MPLCRSKVQQMKVEVDGDERDLLSEMIGELIDEDLAHGAELQADGDVDVGDEGAPDEWSPGESPPVIGLVAQAV